jgi:hypothetical protein
VIAVRHARDEELEELHERLRVEWTGDVLVSRGVAHELSELSLLVALDAGAIVGLAIHRGAVDDARRLKSSIPLVGEHGIEIHDELEFELVLG